MDRVLYWITATVVKLLQWPSLPTVARIGRAAGALFYWIDVRHRRVALQNLTHCFAGEYSSIQIRALARENFRRLGENYCCAVKSAAMTWAELAPHCEIVGSETVLAGAARAPSGNVVVAIGHFGNFELYARLGQMAPGFRTATTYRGLRQPSLDRLLQSLRRQSGCQFFERRTEAAALKAALSIPGLILGLLADQHAGRSGIRVPFFGRECATTTAPAVLALRYHAPLFTGICYRVGLARWRIEGGAEIATRDEHGRPRSIRDITLEINRAFETAVRRDPANWFWVHNRWKPERNKPAAEKTAPQSATPVATAKL